VAEKAQPRLVVPRPALEGTCTGEHGVGLHKMDFLVTEAGAGAVDMMRTIKRPSTEEHHEPRQDLRAVADGGTRPGPG
jgi:hypothetical protein